MNKQLIVIVLLLFGFVCISSAASKAKIASKPAKTSKVKITYITPHLSPEQLNDYVRRVFEEGDTAAYLELWKEPVPFLLCSLVMANKYNYTQAFYEVYDSMISTYANGFDNIPIDTVTFNLAYGYLKRGVDLGSKSAKFSMSMLLLKGIFVPQDTILAKKLYFEADLYNRDSVRLEKGWQIMMKNYSGYSYRKDLKWHHKL